MGYPGSLSHDDGNGWMSGADESSGWGSRRDSVRFHHATQKGVQFKTYELLISGIFHLMFLG